MPFMSTRGKRFRAAAHMDILVGSGVVATGSIHPVMEGKHYKRNMRALKLMFEDGMVIN